MRRQEQTTADNAIHSLTHMTQDVFTLKVRYLSAVRNLLFIEILFFL